MSISTSSGAAFPDVFFAVGGLEGGSPIIPPGGVVITMSPPAPPPPPPPPPPVALPNFVVSDGQTSAGIVVSSGGTPTVDSGGTAVGTTVQSGGWMMIEGGVASAASLSGSGNEYAIEYAYSGSTLIDTTVYSGGALNLQAGAHLQGLTIVYSGGGIGGGTTVDSGGMLVPSGGAQLVGSTTISAGGAMVVASGELISAAPIVIGGKLDIQSGGSLPETTLIFGSGGTLQIDDTRAFIPNVQGFDSSNEIDLTAIAFSPGSTTLDYSSNGMIGSNTVGTLTINGGAGMATLVLIGQYAAANFTLADGRHGGTAVYNAPSVLCSDPIQLSTAKTSS